MASDSKASPPPPPSGAPGTPQHRGIGIRIFTYPKVIFIFPTFIASLICGVGMMMIGDNTIDPTKAATASASARDKTVAESKQTAAAPAHPARHERFKTPQNLLGVLFLAVFAFNLLIMGLDFPRFTVILMFVLGLFALFFILWIGAFFDYDLMISVRRVMGSIYVFANAEFYFMLAAILFVLFVVIYLTRWLDYWEILPNEILHHHGPLSDLERLPTLNLKFDKEIPDVLEFLFLGSGRLVLHVSEERKSIVLDNVLFINAKENMLKRLMSRLEVRITSDQEVADETT